VGGAGRHPDEVGRSFGMPLGRPVPCPATHGLNSFFGLIGEATPSGARQIEAGDRNPVDRVTENTWRLQ